MPARCPFERDIQLWGHHLFHVPPMWKLNPVYDELVGLRFRLLWFLADVRMWGKCNALLLVQGCNTSIARRSDFFSWCIAGLVVRSLNVNRGV
ncbi:Mo-dependent nitrogenase C-terminal domain-containing protein [Microcoleus sp. herbarium12]|uniref:Mo-dependent nitrogenase C-terminal domain-containing protein n=1 Tax=Microcoleus sp. herbarium12 TaxID=3055437 RepID=UPI002FCF2B6B